MSKSLAELFNSDYAVIALYGGLLGAIAGEILPTPTDPIDFYLERKWRVQLEQGKITPRQYWHRIEAKYYLLDSAWWVLVLVTAIAIKGDIRKKAMVIGALVGIGAAISVISKNIKADNAYFGQNQFVPKIGPMK